MTIEEKLLYLAARVDALEKAIEQIRRGGFASDQARYLATKG